MNNRVIIMWEITLNCNLDCIFCISKERRNHSEGKITFTEAIQLIDNLPSNTHISFIGGESFLFPRFLEVLRYLDTKGITYEITTNGTLIQNHIEEINSLQNLTNIFFSLDHFGDKHDHIRGKKGIFSSILSLIPKLKTQVNINTIILPETEEKDIIKLNGVFEKMGIHTHRISYYMNFTKEDIQNSQKKIPELQISTKFEEVVDNVKLKIKTIKIYKSLLYIKQNNNYQILIDIHPISILSGGPKKCKSMTNYYRINEYGQLSSCHFIDNSFESVIENKFEDIIQNSLYRELKQKIINNYPLDICITCGKGV